MLRISATAPVSPVWQASRRCRQRPATYKTLWSGAMTFDELYADLRLYVQRVMLRNRVLAHQLPDCLQNGFMALWEALAADPTFLTVRTRKQAVFFVLARCKISSMRYQEARYDRLEMAVDANWRSEPDEVISDIAQTRSERWAAWATQVDMRVDIERLMATLASEADTPRKLLALYTVTTSVRPHDTAPLAGLTMPHWGQHYVTPMRWQVRHRFADVFLETNPYPKQHPPRIRGVSKERISTPLGDPTNLGD